MVRAVENAGVTNGVILNKRWFPAIRLARELIRRGTIGKVTRFRFAYHQDWASKTDAMTWRFRRSLAGSAC